MKTTEKFNIVGYTTDSKKHGLGQNRNFDFYIEVEKSKLTNEFITGAIDQHLNVSVSYEFDVYDAHGSKVM